MAAGLPDELAPFDEPMLPLSDPAHLALELAMSPVGAVDRAAGRGRPKGSRNRRSEELVTFILSQHAHPLLALASTYSRPVAVLAAELGCTKLEAFQIQQRAMAELAPYIESRKPVAVQVDTRVIQLTIHQGAQGDGQTVAEGLHLEMAAPLDEGEQNQGLGA